MHFEICKNVKRVINKMHYFYYYYKSIQRYSVVSLKCFLLLYSSITSLYGLLKIHNSMNMWLFFISGRVCPLSTSSFHIILMTAKYWPRTDFRNIWVWVFKMTQSKFILSVQLISNIMSSCCQKQMLNFCKSYWQIVMVVFTVLSAEAVNYQVSPTTL